VKKGFDGQGDLDTIKEKRTLDNAKKTFAYTTNLEDWRRFIAAINELCPILEQYSNETINIYFDNFIIGKLRYK
jgi:hypothetical protein